MADNQTPSTENSASNQQPVQSANPVQPSAQVPADPQISTPMEPVVPNPEQINQPPVFPPVSSEERLWGLIAYIPLMGVIPLVIKPGSKYLQLHARQGLLLSIIFFISIFIYIVPFIGPLFGGLIQMGTFFLGLIGMYQGFMGEWWKIPVISDISNLIPLEIFAKMSNEAMGDQNGGQAEPDSSSPETSDTTQPPISQ